jgi:hypothetical protein
LRKPVDTSLRPAPGDASRVARRMATDISHMRTVRNKRCCAMQRMRQDIRPNRAAVPGLGAKEMVRNVGPCARRAVPLLCPSARHSMCSERNVSPWQDPRSEPLARPTNIHEPSRRTQCARGGEGDRERERERDRKQFARTLNWRDHLYVSMLKFVVQVMYTCAGALVSRHMLYDYTLYYTLCFMVLVGLLRACLPPDVSAKTKARDCAARSAAWRH